jgi:hypothetical protein
MIVSAVKNWIPTYILCCIVASLGLAARVYILIYQPIWLDEQYSLFFASLYSTKDLLLHLFDVHPGLYYMLLQGSMASVHTLPLLRALTVLIPQILGILILGVYMGYSVRPSRVGILAFITVFSLHPLFIYLSVQLRPYGLVFLFTAILFTMVNRYLQKQNQYLGLAIVILTIISVVFDYSLIPFSIGAFSYLILQSDYSLKKKFGLITGFLCLLAVELFILLGSQYKSVLLDASWIPKPDFINTPRVLMTILGLDTDIHVLNRSIDAAIVLWYLIVAVGIWIVWKNKQLVQSTTGVKLMYFVCIPICILFAVSIVFPFLSHRIFFHRYIPDISLILPRIMLPESIILCLLFAETIAKIWQKTSKRTGIYTLSVLCIVCAVLLRWGYTHTAINALTFGSLRQDTMLEMQDAEYFIQNTQVQKNGMLWPAWFWIRSVTPTDSIGKTKQVQQLYQKSKAFESLVNNAAVTEQNFCALIQTPTVYTMQEVPTMKQDAKQLHSRLHQCCYISRVSERYTVWNCDK